MSFKERDAVPLITDSLNTFDMTVEENLQMYKDTEMVDKSEELISLVAELARHLDSSVDVPLQETDSVKLRFKNQDSDLPLTVSRDVLKVQLKHLQGMNDIEVTNDLFHPYVTRVMKMGFSRKQFINSSDNFFMVFKRICSFYLPPADRPGTGDYKMPTVRACVRSSRFYKSLSIS